ncbi:unnamed protein product [Albugo candida]|uniref:Uncharacterized protein n=1 Tax=Albugo candida TaxID=65357 RepID=A0A024FVB6_9STRA|nr:unnamed protein product [Albugo candida]|eukprot:CCI10594.1 unnamed protein product [Albugo candida]
MCMYRKHVERDIIVVGVYLLVTATNAALMDTCLDQLQDLYDIDQEVTIREMFKDNGLEDARGIRLSIREEANEVDETDENSPDIFKMGKQRSGIFNL